MTTILPAPKSGRINHICHISDIHIRAGTDNNDNNVTRFQEYITVFQRICIFLEKNYSNHDFVIVITGDILHNNKKMGSSCIQLFYDIIYRFSALAPVYFIRGNHDYNQSSIEDQDLLGSLMNGFGCFAFNIAYLNKTGIYQAANVVFSVVAIQDALKAGNTSGRNDMLPDFPICNDDNITKIALFHGDIPGTYPIDWICSDKNKFDFILLGDLHNLQVHNAIVNAGEACKAYDIMMINSYTPSNVDKPMWAYPGSTIQQNFGESLLGHGFLMWDLECKSVKAFHVKNDYGLVTVKYIDGVCNVLMNDNKWVSIDTAISYWWFPKNINLRIIHDKNSCLSIQDVFNDLAKYDLIINSSKATQCDNFLIYNNNNIQEVISKDITRFNDPLAWCEYINKTVQTDDLRYMDWKSWIVSPESLLFKSNEYEHIITIGQDISDKNKKINDALASYKNSRDILESSAFNHTSFELVYMDWAYILCFKDECHFNFQDLNGKVHCIAGKNGHGKTSFLETICIALFGASSPSRTSKYLSSSIICQQRPAKSRSFTSIMFIKDKIKYKLTRVFDMSLNKLNNKEVVLERFDFDKNNFTELNSGKAANDWIKVYLGTFEDFLTSCMITQTFDEDFFAKKLPDQKAFLNKRLRLDASSVFQDVLKTSYNAYEDISKKIFSIIELKKHDVYSLKFNSDELDAKRKMLNDIEEQIVNNIYDCSNMKLIWQTVNEKILTVGKEELTIEQSNIHAELKDITSDDSETLIEKKGNIKKEYDDLVKDHKLSDLNSDYLLSKYNNLNNLQSIFQQHISIKPSINVTDSELNQMKLRLKKWMDCLLKYVNVKNGNDIKAILDDNIVIQSEYQSKMDSLKLKRIELENKKSDIDNALNVAESDFTSILHDKPIVPKYADLKLKQQRSIDLAHFNNLKTTLKNIENASAIVELYPVLNAQLKNAQTNLAEKLDILNACDKHDFDPNCKACMSHPWKLKIDEFDRACTDLQILIDNIKHDMIEQFGSLDIEYTKMKEFEKLKVFWSEQFVLEKVFDEWNTIMLSKQKLHMDLKDRSKVISSDLIKNKKDIDEICEKLRKCDQLVTKLGELHDEWINDIMILNNNIQQNIIAVREWNNWNETHQVLENDLEIWRIIEESAKARMLYDELINIDLLINNNKKSQALFLRLADIDSALQVIDIYDIYNDIGRKNDILFAKKNELKFEIAQLVLVEDKVKETLLYIDNLISIHSNLNNTIFTMKAIIEQFANFKDWVLQYQIIPSLLQHINKLLMIMCKNHRNINLDCVFDESGQFNWIIKDGNNSPPIEKASGFQKFTISLATRIVLGHFGAAGIKNTQLFIDEGFTACDNDNLENVPVVLKELLTIYDAIVIVSHLDDLKQGISSSINIDRDPIKQLSQIKFGTVLSSMPLSNIRKRGRPKKCIDVPANIA